MQSKGGEKKEWFSFDGGWSEKNKYGEIHMDWMIDYAMTPSYGMLFYLCPSILSG